MSVVIWTSPRVILLRRAPDFVFWFDQGQYFRSANAFLSGNLAVTDHWYPFLYPLLLSLVAWMPPFIAALCANLTLYTITYSAFSRVCHSFAVSKPMSLFIFFLSTLGCFQFSDAWIQPWTTTLSACLIWMGIAITCELQSAAGDVYYRKTKCIALGAVLVAIAFTRPADVVVSVVMALFVVLTHGLQRKRWGDVSLIGYAATVTCCPLIALHVLIYGWAPSPYMRLSAEYGIIPATILWKTYIIFIEPRPWYPYGCGILKAFPWLIICFGGMLTTPLFYQSRPQAVLISIIVFVYIAMMVTYVDLLPSGLWKYGNFHYFKWTIPALMLFGYLFLRELRNRFAVFACVFTALCLLTSIRVLPTRAGPSESARALTFYSPKAPFADIYFARSTINDAKGVLRNRFDYHQVPAADGLVIMEALRRDFVGQEYWNDPGNATWPYLPPDAGITHRLAGPFPKLPLHRYKTAIGFGLPCWLPLYDCSSSF